MMKKVLLCVIASTLLYAACTNEAAEINATATDTANKTTIGDTTNAKEDKK